MSPEGNGLESSGDGPCSEAWPPYVLQAEGERPLCSGSWPEPWEAETPPSCGKLVGHCPQVTLPQRPLSPFPSLLLTPPHLSGDSWEGLMPALAPIGGRRGFLKEEPGHPSSLAPQRLDLARDSDLDMGVLGCKRPRSGQGFRTLSQPFLSGRLEGPGARSALLSGRAEGLSAHWISRPPCCPFPKLLTDLTPWGAEGRFSCFL